MGEIADMMLDGTLCDVCGVIMDDIAADHDMDSPGYPRTCAGCSEPAPRSRRKKFRKASKRPEVTP